MAVDDREREQRERERRAQRERQQMRDRLAARPANVRFGELEAVILAHGYAYLRGSGSHLMYGKDGYPLFVVPYRRGTVLPAYVRSAMRRLDAEDSPVSEDG
jgi:predicted RNA binding protein YcfA (HicA-like mRNA interferase family)